MQIKTKYGLGDVVVSILDFARDTQGVCKTCNGATEVTINGKEFNCPDCFGHGFHWQREEKKWQINKTLTIGQVRAEIEKKSRKIIYMCKETGIGSGTLWDESLLFFSEDEAQAECDRRNADPR